MQYGFEFSVWRQDEKDQKRFYEQSKGKNGSAKIEVEDDFLCPGLYPR